MLELDNGEMEIGERCKRQIHISVNAFIDLLAICLI